MNASYRSADLARAACAAGSGKAGVVGSDIRFRCFEEFAAHGISLPLAFPGDVASPRQIGEHSPHPNS